MATIVSGASAYLTGAQFLRYYDSRTVAELLSDSSTKVLDPAGNAYMLELLQAASGQVEASARKGGRYESTDLTALAAGSTNGAFYLRKLVAGVAMQDLRSRRARVGEDLLEQFKWVRDALKALRQGEEIFGFVENQTAATTHSDPDNATTRQQRSGISINASPYFGVRGGDRRY
jgi:hypothetical protein